MTVYTNYHDTNNDCHDTLCRIIVAIDLWSCEFYENLQYLIFYYNTDMKRIKTNNMNQNRIKGQNGIKQWMT